MILIYHVIAWFIKTFGDPQMTGFWEHRGYRRAVGGRWGKWEMRCTGFGIVTMWWPSPCEHYPPPPLAAHTEPIEIEDYVR